MHLTVIDADADIAGVGAGQRTLLHAAHDPLEDGREEASIDGAAYDAVDEDEFAAPLEVVNLRVADVHAILLAAEAVGAGGWHALVVGLDDEVHLPKLSGAARLFLVAIVSPGGLGDRLAVGDFRLEKLDGQLVVVLDAPLEGAEVEFALT